MTMVELRFYGVTPYDGGVYITDMGTRLSFLLSRDN